MLQSQNVIITKRTFHKVHNFNIIFLCKLWNIRNVYITKTVPKKGKRRKNSRLFLKKLLTICKLTIKISLRNKKRQPHIYPPAPTGRIYPGICYRTNILGFQLPFFLYYDYGLNAFNCQAICYFIVAYSAWLFLFITEYNLRIKFFFNFLGCSELIFDFALILVNANSQSND